MLKKVECIKDIVLFGAGKRGRKALSHFGKERVLFFCDNNEKIVGTQIDGVNVVGFDELTRKNLDKVKICITVVNPQSVSQIKQKLSMVNAEIFYYDDDEFYNGDILDIFDCIYKQHAWGGGGLYSGDGSHDEVIINPYMELLKQFIFGNAIESILDIGCGDFNIMKRVLESLDLVGYNYNYYGIDAAASVIDSNNRNYGNDKVNFVHMDATKIEQMPVADLVIIRQVMQHLDNKSIYNLVKRLKSYHYVLYTEHVYLGDGVIYNIDKKIGPQIRLGRKSGVYLEKAPYNCQNIIHLLSIPNNGGVIRTSLMINEV